MANNSENHPWGYQANANRIARRKAIKKVAEALKQIEQDKKNK